MTAERRSEVASWGCMRVIRVSGQWWSVAGGGLACPPRPAAFPPGPLCLSGRSHSTLHDLTSMLRSSFLKSELLGSRKTDSEKPHRLLALTIISLCSYIKKNIYCFITNNHREAPSVETEPVYESPGSRACSRCTQRQRGGRAETGVRVSHVTRTTCGNPNAPRELRASISSPVKRAR